LRFRYFIIVFLVIGIVGCGKNERAVMTGIVVKLGEDTVLVVEEIEKNPRAINVSITNAIITDEKKSNISKDHLKLGMNVEVWVTGEIAESYPEQARGSKLVIKSQENKNESLISRSEAIEKALEYSKGEINNQYIRKAQFHAEIKQWYVEVGNYLEEAKVIKKIGSDTGEVIDK